MVNYILVLLITVLVMGIIYFQLQKLDNDVEYVVKYSKTNNTSQNTSIPSK